MKALARSVSKHLLSFALYLLALGLLNGLLFVLTFFHTIRSDYGAAAPSSMLERFDGTGVEQAAPDQVVDELRLHHIWAMFLSDDGNRTWAVDAPAEIPERYTVQDVAVFSRGYLNDYPVFVRSFPHGLLVLGYPKDSYTKITGNFFSLSAIRTLPLYGMGILILDFLFLFGVFCISRRRMTQSIGPLLSAVEQLAEGKPAALSVSGELAEVARSVSKASQLISRQNQARANWISGVSHDIRTPLSMIMGYAQKIADDEAASENVRSEAAIVQRQSLKIRDLVQDLNLVSKLEYEMQPLHREPVRLARFLRSYTADLLNSGLPDGYSVGLSLSPDAEGLMLDGDPRLLSRAVNNLVQNSIRHNPQGCTITLSLEGTPDEAILSVADDGVGLTGEKLHEMQFTPHYLESSDEPFPLRHGMGWLLVRRIAAAHGGKAEIRSKPQAGCTTLLRFPLKEFS